MCGIAGFIDYYGNCYNQNLIIDNMIDSLKYRGPDSNGKYLDKFATLGHSRLAVVDVKNGFQPMIKHHNGIKYTIVYNGELYNCPELKNNLLEKGYTFKTNCDTEILLTTFIEYGHSCPEKLNGIFAFAIWNEKELFIARDRFGVKPLFYTIKNSQFIFGSEIKALFKHADVRPQLDKIGILEIFAIGPARTPTCGVFKDIFELAPATYAVYNKDGFHLSKYFKLTACEHTDNYEETVQTVRYLLQDSIERQLVSDVPICTLLSGGVDSSIISAVAAQYLKKQDKSLDTYSFDFHQNNEFFKASSFQAMQDRPFVEIMIEKISSNHKFLEISYKDSLESLFEAVIAKDLPSMTDIDSSLLCFSKLIKQNHTVCLSGECADEVFGGYPWFYDERTYSINEFPWSRDTSLRKSIVNDSLSLDIDDYINEKYQASIVETDYLLGETPKKRREREIMLLNINWFMQTLLDRKDRMTMRSSLEVRVPFADHRLIQYLYNIPWEFKSKNGVKGLLKDAFSDIIPQEVLYRKKTPYPKTYNPAFENELKSMLKSSLKSGNVISYLVNKETINKLLSDENSVEVPWFGQLMKKPQVFAYLLQIDFWFSHYDIELLF